MVKLYISGQITGRPDYKKQFYDMAHLLESWGYTALNPAVLPEGMSKADYMRIDMSMLDTADALVAMRGWGSSPGANIEVCYALYTGKPVIFADCTDDELKKRIQEEFKTGGAEHEQSRWEGGGSSGHPHGEEGKAAPVGSGEAAARPLEKA